MLHFSGTYTCVTHFPALLKNLLSDWEDSERTLYIDCREGDFTTPEKFAQAVLKRISPAWPSALFPCTSTCSI